MRCLKTSSGFTRTMRVFKNIYSIAIKRPVATIGIFDGVHLAHQAIIEKLKLKAFELNGESTLITFWPHPRIVLNKDADTLRMLNTLDEKILRLEATGIDNLVILPFDTRFAATSFDAFIRNILVDQLKIVHLVVGFNHHFGKNREGNFEKLQQLSDDLGFGLSQQDPILFQDEKISSSTIRHLLENGELQKVNHFLGYTYGFTGQVVHGNHKGREIGFPTANLEPLESIKMIPKTGVYAIHARLDGQLYKGMMNIGFRPTLKSEVAKQVIEAHLFDFNANLYGRQLRVECIARIRDEQKFNSFEELRLQIEKDREFIKKMMDEA